MRTRDIFCASQASTEICMGMDMDEPSSSNTIQLGGKTIDRHNPIITDQRRTPRTLPSLAPCTFQTPPVNPKPYHLLHKNKKTSFANEHSKKLPSKSKKLSSKPTLNHYEDAKKKNSATEFTVSKDIATKTWIDQHRDFITPPGSSRYLLGESTRFYDGISGLDSVLGLVPVESNRANVLIHEDESSASKPSSSRSEKSNSDQVVVLRVSLHCRGCEGKVRKHLSRMQGVTSFNIDFAAKKVTIVGDVNPLGVLASVSKVKNAQFWTPPTIDTTTNLKIGFMK